MSAGDASAAATQGGDPGLSEGQQRALRAASEGVSVFFTGPGGSGKSFLLAVIMKEMKARLGDQAVYCTAMTGASAAAIGGQTVHAFAGIGLGDGGAEELAKRARRGEARSRWEKCKALIIDEISMMDGDLFTKLEFVARRVRNRPQRAFGGIQLILCGDLYQLPPIKAKKLVFQSEAWHPCMQLHLELDTNFRQRDRNFSAILSRVRTGTATPFDITFLQKLNRPLKECMVVDEDGRDFVVEPTRLYATNRDVSAENDDALSKLPGPTVRFEAQDEGMRVEVLEKCAAPPTLLLRVGAQVMLVKNINTKNGLVNGARGVVVAFNKDWENAPMVVFDHGNGREVTLPAEEFVVYQGGIEVACRLQIPLRLAWALTIHKAQGASLDSAVVDLKGVHNCGQAYVAMSRVRSPEGLHLINFVPESLKVDPRVKEFMKWVEKEGGTLREQTSLDDGSSDVDSDGWTTAKRHKSGADNF